jgi:cell division protein FtsI/penicillin-binding protein 2
MIQGLEFPSVRRFVHFLILTAILIAPLSAARRPVRNKRVVKHGVSHRTRSARAVSPRAATARGAVIRRVNFVPRRDVLTGPVIRGGPWISPTFADSTAGDFADGEDLEVRRAATEALGKYNGSVIVADANTGRILSMVNQRTALGSGFQPCSTIKLSVALTALREKVIAPGQKMLGMNLTYALAHSNNAFFASLGTRLGYDTVSRYARLFGYGETAGWNIAGEQAGYYPSAPPKNGGMGMLTSFGEEISQTPLQLTALMCALANGGHLYYLQYPHSQVEASHFIPRIKRELNIQDLIPAVKPGMLGAVAYGTARRATPDQPIAGKTGTCTGSQTHLGWFGSFNDTGDRKLVVVVLLTGGRPSVGPLAARVAGEVYRGLGEVNYFARNRGIAPLPLAAAPMCCAR